MRNDTKTRIPATDTILAPCLGCIQWQPYKYKQLSYKEQDCVDCAFDPDNLLTPYLLARTVVFHCSK
jgi:hypothetical protein